MHPLPLAICLSLAAMPGLAQETGLAALVQGIEWQIHEIAGQPVPEGAAPTLIQTEPGRLAGRGGCNRFSAVLSQQGPSLTIGPVAATRMACPPPRMAVESAFFDALARVTGAAKTAEGLVLMDETGAVLRAHRTTPG